MPKLGDVNNPKGRPVGAVNKGTAEIKALAQIYGPEAILELVRLMREGELEKTRVTAISELLDRGYGKATQAVEANVNIRKALAVRLDVVMQKIDCGDVAHALGHENDE